MMGSCGECRWSGWSSSPRLLLRLSEQRARQKRPHPKLYCSPRTLAARCSVPVGAAEASKQRQQLGRMMLERMPRFAEVREDRLDRGPEPRTVIHLAKMREFVRDHIVNDVHREMNQPPVQADLAVAGTAAPARGSRRQRISPELHTQFGRIHRQPFAKNLQGLNMQPALHPLANELSICQCGDAQ